MIRIVDHASLLPYNTFGIDATACRLVEYSTVSDLRSICPVKGDFLNVGVGSNLLFTGPYQGTVLHSLICHCDIIDRTPESVIVNVGAGVVWDDFVAWAVVSGFGGVENLSLIPGETGSAAVQNIGAYGVEAKDVIRAVNTIDLLTGRERRFPAAECDYGYRQSVFKRPEMKRYTVTSVEFELSACPSPNLSYKALRDRVEEWGIEPTPAAIRRAVISLRQGKLPEPAKYGNAGSFFTNPVVSARQAADLLGRWPDMPHYPAPDGVKLSAGWLIDRAGWKGKALGRAGVYSRQALVLVNLGGATGREIVDLANAVISSVKEIYGVTLTPEVNII